MSRIGKMPIVIPAGVSVEVAENNKVTVKGPKGELTRVLPAEMKIEVENGQVKVSRPNDLKRVHEGYTKTLEINGVGYRAAKEGNKLTLSLGYSHPVVMIDPEGIESVCETPNKIVIKGIDKEKLGQYAAEIRSKRGPEPYKGKGIKYATETIRRKVGKAGKK